MLGFMVKRQYGFFGGGFYMFLGIQSLLIHSMRSFKAPQTSQHHQTIITTYKNNNKKCRVCVCVCVGGWKIDY